jgi:hypothetical protein
VRIEKIKIEKIEKKIIEKPDNDSSTESYTDNPNNQRDGKLIEIVNTVIKPIIKFLKNPFGGGNNVREGVFEEDVEDESHLWKKGQLIEDGYFTLEVETPKGPMVLTANSEGGLEIEGNFSCNGKHFRSSKNFD